MKRTREMAEGAGVACHYCREEQLSKECCRGGLLPRPAGLGGLLPDGEEDRISALSDDILLQILARLGCARAAAHTGLLARRWRGIWARLPAFTFHCIAPDPLDAALALVARPAPSLIDIEFMFHHELEPARVSSFLGAAAALAPAELVVYAGGGTPRSPVELPCFDRATSIKLNLYFVGLTLPPAGGFPALESLFLENCYIDLSDLLPRCPRLRKLWLPTWNSGSVNVNSPSLEDLCVCANFQIQHLEIVTPALKKLYLNATRGISKDCSFSFSAPAVENLTWKCECRALSYMFGVVWRLWNLELHTCLEPLGPLCLQSQHPPRDGILSLNLEANVLSGDTGKTFEQEMYRFQVTNFSILELDLIQRGHAYGAIVLHLLGLCTSIQRLTVTLDEFIMEDACYADCRCDQRQPIGWRSQNISFIDLKEVKIQGFRGQDHELDLLKVLVRCASVLERVTLRFSRKVSPSESGCMKLDGILKAYPSVKCTVYQSGKQVLTQE